MSRRKMLVADLLCGAGGSVSMMKAEVKAIMADAATVAAPARERAVA